MKMQLFLSYGSVINVDTTKYDGTTREIMEYLIDSLSFCENYILTMEEENEMLSQQIHYQGLILHAHSQEAKN